MAEDVYLLGFSLVNKKLHKNINKILKRSKVKPDQTTRNVDQTGDNTELITVSESEVRIIDNSVYLFEENGQGATITADGSH